MVDVSVAVSTEAGLITPIVFGADTKVRWFLAFFYQNLNGVDNAVQYL